MSENIVTIGAGGTYATFADMNADGAGPGGSPLRIRPIVGVKALDSVNGWPTDGMLGAGVTQIILEPNTGAILASVSLLADNAGQCVLTGTLPISNDGTVPITISPGLQFGSAAGTRGLISFSPGGGGQLTINGCQFRDSQAQSAGTVNIVTASPTDADTNNLLLVQNCVIINPVVKTGGTKRGLFLNIGTGTKLSAQVYHNTVDPTNFTFGMAQTYAGTGQLSRDSRNNVVVGSSASSPSFGNVTATGTLTLNASESGNRGSNAVWGTTDCTSGLAFSDVFINTSTGYQILTNATTLISAVTTPTAMDIDGNARPQDGPKVFVGAQDARPLAPPNVVAVALSSTSIRVTWSASIDPTAATYNVYMDAFGPVNTASLSHDFTGLSPSSTHTFSISSSNGGGTVQGPKGTQVQATTLAGGGGGNTSSADTIQQSVLMQLFH